MRVNRDTASPGPARCASESGAGNEVSWSPQHKGRANAPCTVDRDVQKSSAAATPFARAGARGSEYRAALTRFSRAPLRKGGARTQAHQVDLSREPAGTLCHHTLSATPLAERDAAGRASESIEETDGAVRRRGVPGRFVPGPHGASIVRARENARLGRNNPTEECVPE